MINATGVVVHTNLGRALLPRAAVEAVVTAAMSYSDLEYGLAQGERASRQDHVHDVLCTVTGAEDALAVNNNAAAVLLALAATARGGEVLVSRGQLVEIGDGFRIPDILRESGAELVEVGTTNRTYLEDFEAAWTDRTRAILRVHTSNYRIVGFTTEPTLEELADAGARARRWCSWTTSAAGRSADLDLFTEEPTLADSVAAGCDIVTFSGDKLLGGPQAGIAVGRAAAIEAMRRHPLARALRIDKMTSPRSTSSCACTSIPERAVARDPHARGARVPARGRPRARRAAARAADRRRRARRPSRARRRRSPAPAPARCRSPRSRASRSRPRCPRPRPTARAELLRRGAPAVVCRVHDGRLLLDLRAGRATTSVEDLAGAAAPRRSI